MTTYHPTTAVKDEQLKMEHTAEFLIKSGWREYPNQFKKYARCFYKSFDTPTRCHGNDDKPGIQVELSVSITARDEKAWVSYEVSLTGGLEDGTWISIHNYSLPKDIRNVVGLIPRMLATWEAANL